MSVRQPLTQVFAALLVAFFCVTARAQDTGDPALPDPGLSGPEFPTDPALDPGLPDQPPPPDALPPDAETPPPGDIPPDAETPSPGDVPPSDIPPSEPPLPEQPPWTYQWEHTNRQGTVSNVHQGYRSEDGSTWRRQHVVTNPRGQRTQDWERIQTEDGYTYRRSHTFAAPDGTVYRQHEQTFSGTDPYNYQRQKTMQFRDGRTMEMTQTRSWDGETGTMERTFIGPNGQNRTFQRSWTPDELAGDAEAGFPEQPPQSPDQLAPPEAPPDAPVVDPPQAAADVPTVDPPQPTPEAPDGESFLSKLNPFRKGPEHRMGSMGQAQRSWGFTVGSRGRGFTTAPRHGLNDTQPGRQRSLLAPAVQARAAKMKHVQKTNPGLGRMNGHSRASRSQ